MRTWIRIVGTHAVAGKYGKGAYSSLYIYERNLDYAIFKWPLLFANSLSYLCHFRLHRTASLSTSVCKPFHQ
jgi:hypothetical protein